MTQTAGQTSQTNHPNLLPALQQQHPTLDGKERGQLRSTIVQAAMRLNDAQWGAAGNITGMTQRIPRQDLWVNPCSVDYINTAIAEMAETLKLDGQLQPLTVTPAIDQRTFAEGGIGGKFLILDGKLRYLAAARTGIPVLEDLDCVVRVYPDPYSATLAGVIMKTSLHTLADDQAGRLLRRLYAVYEEALRRRLSVGDWPTQEEWARHFGRSQPTIARWMGIARLPEQVREAVDSGAIEEHQAAELLGASRRVQQEVGAAIVETNASGMPMPQKAVRAKVRERALGPAQTPDSVLVRPPQQLRLPFLAEKPAVEALRVLLHDAYAWLGDALGQMEHPDRDWMALYRALNQPKIVDFMRGEDDSTSRVRKATRS